MNHGEHDAYRNQLDEALDRLLAEVRGGLEHGFFEITLSSEIMKAGKRRFVIKAGKMHQFTIPEEDLRDR